VAFTENRPEFPCSRVLKLRTQYKPAAQAREIVDDFG
jgi:hypothetical protein